MTDRLKEWLDDQDGPSGYNLRASLAGQKALAALRAVVELHSPVGQGRYRVCGHCGDERAEAGPPFWPCYTVRAIEKEVFCG